MNKPINVLLVNGPLPPPYGGVSSYLAHALPYLTSRGFVIHTIMDKKPTDVQQYATFENCGIHIHYGGGNRLQKIVRILKYLPLWITLARKSRLPFLYLLKTIVSQASWIGITEKIVRQYPIDILHAYDYPWIQGFVALHIAKKYGKKSIQTTFGEVVPHMEELIQHDAIGQYYKHLVTEVLQEFDCVITLSNHCAKELQTVGIQPNRIRVTYYGVDINKFKPSNDSSQSRKFFKIGIRPTILFVGHIRPRKGPQILLESIPSIVKEIPDVLVIFVGPDYGILDQLKKRAESLNITSNVLFTPPLPDSTVVSLYAACDIFAFPSCTAIECFGLSMVQAMASAKPVVGSNIDGIPEVIVDGETGFLVPPGNEVELGKRLVQLLKDKQLREQMGKAGRLRTETLFNQDRRVGELEMLYREFAKHQ
jgi:glycosyltransferase involved in cell wall biosynthesis